MSTRECKQFWKASVEHHAFFRLTKGNQIENGKLNLFQLGSKYRYRLNIFYVFSPYHFSPISLSNSLLHILSGRTIKELASIESRREQPQVYRNSIRSVSSSKPQDLIDSSVPSATMDKTSVTITDRHSHDNQGQHRLIDNTGHRLTVFNSNHLNNSWSKWLVLKY